jgi:hypothetical protein
MAIWVYMESGEWQKLSVYHLNKNRRFPSNKEEAFRVKIEVVIEM